MMPAAPLVVPAALRRYSRQVTPSSAAHADRAGAVKAPSGQVLRVDIGQSIRRMTGATAVRPLASALPMISPGALYPVLGRTKKC
jgi:hypothetical protein